MAFPFALVSQGIGLAASLMGGGGGMSAQLQLEIVRQLSQVNSTLLVQTKIMEDLLSEIKDLPENRYQFDLQQELSSEEEKISDLFRELTPQSGKVEKPEAIYAQFKEAYDRLVDIMDRLEALVRTVATKELSLVGLSYSIVSGINNLLLLNDLCFEPSIMVNLANEDKLNIDTQVVFEPHVTSEKFQATRDDMLDFAKLMVAGNGALFNAYEANHRQKLASFSDSSGSLPGEISITGSGFRQQRFKAFVGRSQIGSSFPHVPIFGADQWVTRSIKITTKITVVDAVEKVEQNESVAARWLKQTGSGGAAKRIRKSFPDANERATARRPGKPYDHRVKEKDIEDALKLKPSSYKVTGNGPKFGKSRWGKGLTRYVEDHFEGLHDDDVKFIRDKSKLTADVRKCEELIAIWIYMEGFELFLLDLIDKNTKIESA